MTTKAAAKKKPAAKAPVKKLAPKKVPAVRVKAGTSKTSAAERRKLFVEAYITNGGNATAAAISAGFSKASAGVRGSELVKDRNVSQEIESRSRAVASKYELTTELAARSIVQELSFDPAKLYDEAGQLKPITELDEDTRMALTAIEFEQVGSTEAPIYVRKVKWATRASARDALMKHLGMFEKDNAQKNPFQEYNEEALDRFIQRKSKEAGIPL